MHSPSSHHQRTSAAAPSGQQKQSNGPRCEYKGATGCSGSSDNDSPLPSHLLKPEFEDGIGSSGGSAGAPANCRTEEQNDVPAVSNATTGTRCIAGVFAGHGMFKRLLGTLVQFATDISPDTGDTVRTLVLALLVNPPDVSYFEHRFCLLSARNFARSAQLSIPATTGQIALEAISKSRVGNIQSPCATRNVRVPV